MTPFRSVDDEVPGRTPGGVKKEQVNVVLQGIDLLATQLIHDGELDAGSAIMFGVEILRRAIKYGIAEDAPSTSSQ